MLENHHVFLRCLFSKNYSVSPVLLLQLRMKAELKTNVRVTLQHTVKISSGLLSVCVCVCSVYCICF